MTSEAAALVASLSVGTRDGGGLRIDLRPGSDSLRMCLAAGPLPEDVVIAEGGVLVFLDREAADRLSGRTLTASAGPDGAAFYLL